MAVRVRKESVTAVFNGVKIESHGHLRDRNKGVKGSKRDLTSQDTQNTAGKELK